MGRQEEQIALLSEPWVTVTFPPDRPPPAATGPGDLGAYCAALEAAPALGALGGWAAAYSSAPSS